MNQDHQHQLSTAIINTEKYFSALVDPTPNYEDPRVQASFTRLAVKISELRGEAPPKKGFVFSPESYTGLRSLLIDLKLAKDVLTNRIQTGSKADGTGRLDPNTFLETVYRRVYEDEKGGFAGIISIARRD